MKTIEVCQMEFSEGGNTLWIHSPDGSTALRIKTRGKITSETCTMSPHTHGDVMIDEDIHICIGKGLTP